MRETLITNTLPCSECSEEIIEGSYAWTDEFEDSLLCDECHRNKEEYFGEGYIAKID